MKLTRTQLQEIIKEELSTALNEQPPANQFTTGAKLGSAEWEKQLQAALKAMVDVLNRAADPASQKKAKIMKAVMQKTIAGALPAAGTLFAPEKPADKDTFGGRYRTTDIDATGPQTSTLPDVHRPR
jgi:hypothetical protein